MVIIVIESIAVIVELKHQSNVGITISKLVNHKVGVFPQATSSGMELPLKGQLYCERKLVHSRLIHVFQILEVLAIMPDGNRLIAASTNRDFSFF
jgi:hypothetical protein